MRVAVLRNALWGRGAGHHAWHGGRRPTSCRTGLRVPQLQLQRIVHYSAAARVATRCLFAFGLIAVLHRLIKPLQWLRWYRKPAIQLTLYIDCCGSQLLRRCESRCRCCVRAAQQCGVHTRAGGSTSAQWRIFISTLALQASSGGRLRLQKQQQVLACFRTQNSVCGRRTATPPPSADAQPVHPRVRTAASICSAATRPQPASSLPAV